MGSEEVENLNNTFFKGSYKEVWKALNPKGLTEAETDFLLDVCKLEKGDSVLDLMCGYGRHTIALARKGINVSAVDNLPEYIMEVKENTIRESFPVEAILSDVLSLDLEKKYEAAICMGNSFSFFDKRQIRLLLKYLSSILKGNAVLVVNSWMLSEIAVKNFKERDWYFAGNYKCILENKFLFSPTRIEFIHTILSSSGVYEETSGVDFIYSISELEDMFYNSNLKIENVFSTPRKKRFSLGDNQAYIVATKIN